jgi:hypothetical protein
MLGLKGREGCIQWGGGGGAELKIIGMELRVRQSAALEVWLPFASGSHKEESAAYCQCNDMAVARDTAEFCSVREVRIACTSKPSG